MKSPVGTGLALFAAAATAASAFLPWVGTKPAAVLPLSGLWNGYTGATVGFGTSLGLALLVVAAVFVASAVSGSRLLSVVGTVVLAGLLWAWVEQSRALRDLVGFLVDDASYGAWLAGIAVLVGVVASVVPRTVSRTYANI